MKKTTLLSCALLMGTYAMAQQALFGGGEIKSPEINADHTVTFRVQAPKAVSVQVSGDFLPETMIDTPQGKWAVNTPADLVEKNGVWEFTTKEPLPANYYTYNFIIDGKKELKK